MFFWRLCTGLAIMANFEQINAVDFSIVIAVYNSSGSLRELYRRLSSLFDHELDASFEIIFVDDASQNPKTWPTIRSLEENDSRVQGFQLMGNVGQHNATMCGLRHSIGSRVVTMDDDLQHQPEEISKMIEKMDANSSLDAVFAIPHTRKHHKARNIGSKILNRVLGLATNKPQDLVLSSFRLISRDLCDALISYRGAIITMGSLICNCTQNIENVRVNHASRKSGRSGYTLSKLLGLSAGNILNFSDLPLKIISYSGFFFSMIAFLYALLVIYQRLIGQITLSGFTTIVVLLSFFSGLLLFAIGVLGQYMMRILKTVTFGGQYIIRSKAKKDHRG